MRLPYVLALALLAVPLAIASGDHDEDGDDDGAEPYEWAGIFDVSEHNYIHWVAQKVDGEYADDHMLMVVIGDLADDEEDTLEDEESHADKLLESGNCTETEVSGDMIVPTEEGCYELHFDNTTFESVFTMNVKSHDYIAIFTEHLPTEFEDTTHYLRSTDGDDIEPHHELPEDHDDDDDHDDEHQWGLVILSTIIINLATLSGVAFLGLGIIAANVSPMFRGALQGFSSGALMGAAVFLILVESSHMIGAEHQEEAEVAWRWGASVLGGFLTPLACFLLEPSKLWRPASTPEGTKVPAAETEMSTAVAVPAGGESSLDGDNDDEKTVSKTSNVALAITEVNIATVHNKQMTTVFAICAGDFAHNLTDGFAIGIAFKHCNNSLAWGILAATLYHEIAQELADFVLLTSDVGCTAAQALLFNFIAGTSVILGGLIGHGIDVSESAMGVILAFGGGTYVYLAAGEALPMALRSSGASSTMAETKKHYAGVLIAFIIGAVLVGLVLLNHEHCVAEEDGEEGGETDAHGHRLLM